MKIHYVIALSVLASLHLPPTTAAMANSSPTPIHYQDVSGILEDLHITEPAANIVAMTSTPDDQHRAFMFSDNHQIKIYRDDSLMYTGPLSECSTDPYLFWMTPDGHVVSVPDCKTLYFDDQIVSRNNGVLTYGKDSAVYLNGMLLYPEKTAVKSFNPKTKSSTVLFEHPGEEIQYIRANAKAITYSTKERISGTYQLYLQGKKVSPEAIANPANFALSAQGDIYYFVDTKSQHYTIYKNAKPYLSRPGISGFIFLDDRNTLWHISYRLKPSGSMGRLYLFKGTGRKNYLPATAENAEGFMAFSKGSFALRAQRWSDFYLFKNGQFEGTSFDFSSTGAYAGRKDYNGLFFAPDGSVFMRNYSQGNWYAFRDGQMLTEHEFQDVWYVHLDTQGNVQIYGTK